MKAAQAAVQAARSRSEAQRQGHRSLARADPALMPLMCACLCALLQVATLRSAVKLEQEQQFLIAKKLQELTGSKNIKLKPTIDKSLIAGFVVEYGSSQIDLSVRGQLEKVQDELQGQLVAKFA